MQRYTECNASQAEWLGYLPSHWECKKIGSLFTERKAKVSDKDYAPLSVTKMGILPQLEHAAKTNDGDNRKLVCAGDFVINSRSDRKGSCGVSDLDGSVSLINLILTPRGRWNHRYVHYLLRSHPFSEEYYRNGRGIVADLWTTRYSEMKSILLPVPPREEQDQIVRFLDWKVSSINKLTAIRKKQIAEFEALRRRIILSAVTHGLNKEVPFKRCEEEWISEMPIHWSLLPIKRLFKIFSGATPQSGNSEYWNGDVVWITPADFKTKDRYIYQGAKNLTDSGFYACSATMIPPNSIIFSKRAPVGTVAINKVDLCTNQGCLSCIPFDDVSSEFFYYAMSVCTEEFERRAAGTTFKEISLAAFGAFLMPVPPINEQLEIVNYLDKLCMRIDLAVRNLRSQIEAFDEIKSRVIADTVTGKIDVQNITVPEYEYVEDTADDGREEKSEAKEGFYGEEE